MSVNPRNAAAAAIAVTLAFAFPAAAQAPAAATTAPTVLHLTETVQREVARDLLRATLAAEAIGNDPRQVQGEINKRMTAALARAKQAADVAVETTGYSVFAEQPNKTAATRWHGSQSLTLSGKDFGVILALVGDLQQQGLVTQGLTPDLSRDTRVASEDGLTETALARLRQRADRVAAVLQTKVLGFRDITVGSSAVPMPLMRAAPMVAMASSAPPPVVEPGSATVSVTVSGDILLAPP